MKQGKYIIIVLLIGACALYACDKKHDFIRDNTTPTGIGSAPISTNALIDITAVPTKSLGTSTGSATVYATGTTFKTELQFFSASPIKEINLYNTIGAGTRTKANTIPYAAAFSATKRLDTLVVPYTIPAAPSATTIKLEYEILNQNSLNVIRTVYVKVQ
jgi:hypothetical protein